MLGEFLKGKYFCGMMAIDWYGVLVLGICAESRRAASSVLLRMGFDIDFPGFSCPVAFRGVCSD